MTAFDPVFTIGHQIVETIRTHRKHRQARGAGGSRAAAPARRDRQRRRRAALLSAPAVRRHAAARDDRDGAVLPAQSSSSPTSRRPRSTSPSRRRSCSSSRQLQAEFGMALIMITHDLGVIAETVDRVVVMYGGRVMEEGPVQQIFDAPKHSYTQSLLASLTSRRSKTDERDAARATRRRSSCAISSKIYHAEAPRRHLPHAMSTSTPCARSTSSCRATRSSGSSASPARARRTTGMMAMRLIEPTGGQILVDGDDISRLDSAGAEVLTAGTCRWCSRTAIRRSIR